MGGGKLRVGWGVEQGGPGRHGRVGGVTLSARAHAKLGPHCCWHHMVGWPFLLVQDILKPVVQRGTALGQEPLPLVGCIGIWGDDGSKVQAG